MQNDEAYYLNEALWINAKAPTIEEEASVGGGGGGPGRGGWGLTRGPADGLPIRDPARELPLKQILGEEQGHLDRIFQEKYQTTIKNLPKSIREERKAISDKAKTVGTSPLVQQLTEQQILTLSITKIRAAYMKIVPDAFSYYGAPAFYKRGDSMISRLTQPGVFPQKGEALGREIMTRISRSFEGAYKLHIEAEKLQAFANDLPSLALAIDETELKQPSINLEEIIQRRTAQIATERQIHFDCLPGPLQQELIKSTKIKGTASTVLALAAYKATALKMAAVRQSQIPKFKERNPKINSKRSINPTRPKIAVRSAMRLRRAVPRQERLEVFH